MLFDGLINLGLTERGITYAQRLSDGAAGPKLE
jgi:hypothetical protein